MTPSPFPGGTRLSPVSRSPGLSNPRAGFQRVPPRLVFLTSWALRSKDSSNKESNAESDDEEDSGFKPMFTPQGNLTPATTPISDSENPYEENIDSPQLGHGKHQRFQRTQYQPQTAEYTGTDRQLGENFRLGVLNLDIQGSTVSPDG